MVVYMDPLGKQYIHNRKQHNKPHEHLCTSSLAQETLVLSEGRITYSGWAALTFGFTVQTQALYEGLSAENHINTGAWILQLGFWCFIYLQISEVALRSHIPGKACKPILCKAFGSF